jgi:hypothetical protein
MYTHFKRHVDTLVKVSQAVVRCNQKCLDADGRRLQKSNVTCIHILLSVYIEYYNFNAVFSFLKMCIHFFGTLCMSNGSGVVLCRLPDRHGKDNRRFS